VFLSAFVFVLLFACLFFFPALLALLLWLDNPAVSLYVSNTLVPVPIATCF